MKLSIVATLYNTAPYIEKFCSACRTAATKLAGTDFELLLINDGSPDNSLKLALRVLEHFPQLRIIDLSRNFGHHKAMMTGLMHSRGDLVFLIDSDLEEKPEWLQGFYSYMQETGCDVVYGVQKKRKGGLFERTSGSLFFRLFNIFTGLDINPNIVTSRLMTRRYVNALIGHMEREILIGGLWHITGFDQRPQIIEKQSNSPTSYSLSSKISLTANAITSFSSTPLKGIFYIGLLIFLSACGYTGYLLANRLFFSTPLSGWTSVMASIWLLGGLVILFIGVIGIYLAKVFSEVKQRPYSIVREIYEHPS